MISNHMVDTAIQLCRIAPTGWVMYITGGYVRDLLIGIQPRDIDIEVYHAKPHELVDWARAVDPEADVFGKSFGVIKLTYQGIDFDLSLPRRESKNGEGHTGFDVESDPYMSTREACARRDFTINSMMLRLPDMKLIDHYGGERGIRVRHLIPTSKHFTEDPLRVLRGMQFAARFRLKSNPEFIKYGRKLLDEYHTLPKERVWHEWHKWAKAMYPSMGLKVLQDTGWIKTVPHLHKLIGLEQDARHHKEGGVWKHTLYAVDAVVSRQLTHALPEKDRVICMFAVLCHDFGKITTTEHREDGSITSYGHDVAGEAMALEFMEAIGAPNDISIAVSKLVRQHMRHIFTTSVARRTVRRLARDLVPATIEQWGVVAYADHSGRPPLPVGMHPSAQAIVDMAEEMSIELSPPKHILMGRHLINMGMTPGKEFGVILKAAYEAQLDGAFCDVDEASKWAQEFINRMED